MTGFGAMLGHRAREIVRTWRIWVLPGAALVAALIGPPTARYTRALLQAALGDQAAALPVPDPTALDAYGQWTKNLGQLVLIVVVVTAAGAVNGEVRSGAAVLLLVKPVSRAAFVVAQVVALGGLVVVCGALGVAVTWVGTRLLFGTAPLGPLLAATGVWAVLAVALLAVTVLASCAVDAVAGAAGLGIAAWLALAALGALPAVAAHSPAGLPGLVGSLAAGEHPATVWPLLTGVLLAVLATAAAVAVLQRREL